MKNRLLFVTIGFLLILSTGYSTADEFKTFESETDYFTPIGASKFTATSASEFTANGASKNLF